MINISQRSKKFHIVIELTQIFIIRFPKIWNSYWQDSKVENKIHIEYVNALLHVNKIEKAKNIASTLLIKYPNSVSVHYVLMLIHQKMKDYHNSFSYFESSIKLTDDELVKKDLIILSKTTFTELRFFDKYEGLINELVEQFPNRPDVLSAWLELPVLALPLIKSWEISIKKLQKILDKKNPHIKFLDKYAGLLLSTERIKEADDFLRQQLKIRPKHLGLNRKYCICAHHRKNWEEAERRLDNYYSLFPNDKSDTFFYYIHVLYKLNKFDKLKTKYKKFNSIRFENFSKNDGLDELQIRLLLRDYENLPILDTVIPSNVKSKFKRLYDDSNISIRKVINNPENEVLFVCLGGIHPHAAKQYTLNNFENTYYFDKIVKSKEQSHSFQGLANKTKQFNYLLINDFSSSYGLLNKDLFLKKIEESVKSINHKYLVCIGSSAGAFSSIMIGQLLKANVVFAFMARTQAFLSRTHEFYRDLHISSRLFKPQDIDIGYMQYKSRGFYPKVYMTLCEKQPLDIMSTYTLDRKDPNLHITYCYSDIHNVMKYLGAKNIYTEITKIVERELENRFELPIQTDIFTQLEGYKYNSQEGI